MSAASSAMPPRLEAVLAWDDRRFGPARDLAAVRLAGPEPAWWVYTATLARAPIGSWYSSAPAGAAGTSIDEGEARDRLLGELLERYSALNAPVDGTSALPDLDGLVGRLPRCAPGEPCPPGFQVFDRNVPLTHVPVEHLASGREVQLPAGFVHLGFAPEPPEPHVTLPISTGLAFGRRVEDAIWRGLCEAAERDAMMQMWWLRRRAVEIDCGGPGVPEPLVDRLQRLAAVHLRGRLFDITTDFAVPTVFCVVTGHRTPCLVVGAACNADPVAACAKALDEAVAIRFTLRGLPPFRAPAGNGFDWVQGLEHHALLYADGGSLPAFAFLLDVDGPVCPFERFAATPRWAAPADLDALRTFAGELEAGGLTVTWADVTAPEVRQYGHVVKVVVPELIPLSQSHSVRWLAMPRLRAAAAGRPWPEACNPFPHPFA